MPCDVCPCPKAGFASCPWEAGTHRHPTEIVCDRLRAGRKEYEAETLRLAAMDAMSPPKLQDGVTIGWASEVSRHPIARRIDEYTFLTTDQLARDARGMVAGLPPDIDLVVAIPRSGLVPGAAIAYALHLPLWTVSRQSGVASPGGGFRIGEASSPKHVLVVDDTIATGHEMAACLPLVRARFPDARISTAVVYAAPSAVSRIDHVAAIYPGGHFLDWNFANSYHAEYAGFDMDGILCRDFTHAECETDESYRAAMETITPLFLPRRAPVKMIVTARPEWTRDLTEAWLERYGVRVERLVMWPSKAHPPSSEVGPWKAQHVIKSGLRMFVESDPDQAEIIASIAGVPVVCPAAGRVIIGKTTTIPSTKAESAIPQGQGTIRLGFATPGFAIGGAERHVMQLIHATSQPPFHWAGVACPYPACDQATVTEITAECPVMIGRDAVRELSREVDVMLAWGLPGWAGLIDPAATCKTVLIAHGHNEGDIACNANARAATAIVAVANAAIESLPADQRARARVIHNAPYAKTPLVSRDAQRASWGVPGGVKVLGTLGRLSRDKNPAALPAAVAALPSNWIGVAVGPNPDNLSADRVAYPGPTDDPGSALEAFDAMLMPSAAEGCSIVMIEAWTAGIPVVSTPVGLALEHPEFVRPIPIGADGPTIAAAVLEDAEDIAGTQARVESARDFASCELSTEKFGERWRELLGRLAVPATRVNIREQLDLILSCDYRGPIVKPRCGCQGEWRLCGLGKGTFKAGEVQLGDCLGCVKGG